MLFALADANNFYCSVERVFQPALAHQPLVVLSNNDGCIVSRSNEVKQLGIPMAVPLYQVRHLCRRHHIRIFSSNYALYGDMSRRVMATLARFTPDMEAYSIDEAFLNLTHVPQTQLLAYCQQIKQTVKQWTGIPVAIGVGPTKTLAKLANKIAKQQTESTVFYLPDIRRHSRLMRQTRLDHIWGIGTRSTQKLQRIGIHNLHDFYYADPLQIRTLLGIHGLAVYHELHGRISHHLDTSAQTPRHIMSSRSFATPTGDCYSLRQALTEYVLIATQKLRRHNLRANAICVFIRTNPHRKNEPFYQNQATLALPYPTDDSLLVLKTAQQALRQIYKKHYRYQKLGIILLDLQGRHLPTQFDLFNAPRYSVDKRQKLMRVMDQINARMGNHGVFPATCGSHYRQATNIANRQQFRSPCYTTNWQELVRVR